MSDSENENKNISSGEDEERYIALPAAKNRRNKNAVLLKQRRQKFSCRWERVFPWLKADNVDESIGLCIVCDKRLVCKKSHLERHQKTYKHQRGLGFEDVSTDGNIIGEGDTSVPSPPEFLECGKLEPAEEINEFDHPIELDSEYNMEYADRIKNDKPFETSKCKTSEKPVKIDHVKLLKRIESDRQELNEYYLANRQRQSSSPTSKLSSVALPRDSFDLFFESVSASVKTLPPKLAAEVKIRVSQIIAEFEIRAICEREADPKNIIEQRTPTLLLTSIPTTECESDNQVAHEAIVGTADDASVPQILYTFQPKMPE